MSEGSSSNDETKDTAVTSMRSISYWRIAGILVFFVTYLACLGPLGAVAGRSTFTLVCWEVLSKPARWICNILHIPGSVINEYIQFWARILN
jgi:hypothetical protein